MNSFQSSTRSRSLAVTAAVLSAGLGLGLTGPAQGSATPQSAVAQAQRPVVSAADVLVFTTPGPTPETVELPLTSWSWDAVRDSGGVSVNHMALSADATPDVIALMDWLTWDKGPIPQAVVRTADGEIVLVRARVKSLSEFSGERRGRDVARVGFTLGFDSLERTVGEGTSRLPGSR